MSDMFSKTIKSIGQQGYSQICRAFQKYFMKEFANDEYYCVLSKEGKDVVRLF